MHAHNNHKLINAYEKKTTVVRISIFKRTKQKRVEGAWQEIGWILLEGFLWPKKEQVKSQDTGGRCGCLLFSINLFELASLYELFPTLRLITKILVFFKNILNIYSQSS